MKNNFSKKLRSLALVALAAVVALPLASCVPPPGHHHHHAGVYRGGPVRGDVRPGGQHRSHLAGPGVYRNGPGAPIPAGSPSAFYGGPLGQRR